jgi:hypothetical protein
MPRDASTEFERELDQFGRDVSTGLQTLFTYLAFHSAAHGKKAIISRLNETPLFWNTTMYALQCTYFVVLGRIFDNHSAHNIGKLMRLCQQSPDIFTKGTQSAHNRAHSANADERVSDCLCGAYVPTAADFRRLRKKVAEYRKRYESAYRNIRDKVFAHNQFTERADVDDLLAGATVGELKRIYIFLARLHQALWQLYHNGRKPDLRQQPYSVERLLRKPAEPWRGVTTQEVTTREVKHLLTNVIMKARQAPSPRR